MLYLKVTVKLHIFFIMSLSSGIIEPNVGVDLKASPRIPKNPLETNWWQHSLFHYLATIKWINLKMMEPHLAWLQKLKDNWHSLPASPADLFLLRTPVNLWLGFAQLLRIFLKLTFLSSTWSGLLCALLFFFFIRRRSGFFAGKPFTQGEGVHNALMHISKTKWWCNIF